MIYGEIELRRTEIENILWYFYCECQAHSHEIEEATHESREKSVRAIAKPFVTDICASSRAQNYREPFSMA